jgi:hypothetical protein
MKALIENAKLRAHCKQQDQHPRSKNLYSIVQYPCISSHTPQHQTPFLHSQIFPRPKNLNGTSTHLLLKYSAQFLPKKSTLVVQLTPLSK